MSRFFPKTISLIAAASLAMMFSATPASAAISGRDILIKGPGTGATVYYLATDGKRYVFPNLKTYLTWFSGFSDVATVSQQDLASFPLGGNVTYRPGIKLVKIVSDPKVYAVDNGGVLRWVTSESLAVSLYGSDWSKKVDDVPDAFFTNYSSGASVSDQSAYSPSTVALRSTTINSDKHILMGLSPRRSDTTPPVPIVITPTPSCESDGWSCGSWSACSVTGTQTRGCAMTYDCAVADTPSPATTRTCSGSNPAEFYGSGVLSVTLAPDDYDSQDGIVVGRAESVLARYKFSTQYEDMRLSKAAFVVDTPSAVVNLSLYDGTTLIAGPTGVDSTGRASFSDTDFIVAANSSRMLTVRGLLNAAGPSGASAGSSVRVTLKNTSGSYAFEMRGTASTSSTVITSLPSGDLPGNAKLLFKSRPIVQLQDLPSTILAPGAVTPMRFKVTAEGSDVSIKSLTFGVQKPNATSIAPSGGSTVSAIRRVGDGENLAGATGNSASCGQYAGSVCYVYTSFASEEVIAAGTSRTYDVRLLVAGSLVRGDAVSTTLIGDGTLHSGALKDGSYVGQVGVGGYDAYFAWSDQSVLSHDASVPGSSTDWSNGKYVWYLPTDAQVLAK